MKTTIITNPVFQVLEDQNRHSIIQAIRKSMPEGWRPVGDMAQNGREWVQVMVIEGRVDQAKKKRPRGNPNFGKKEEA